MELATLAVFVNGTIEASLSEEVVIAEELLALTSSQWSCLVEILLGLLWVIGRYIPVARITTAGPCTFTQHFRSET